MDLIEVTEDDGVRVVAMRDDATKNALRAPLVRALEGALAIGDGTRAVVLRGLPDVFSAGADRETLAAVAARRIEPADAGLTSLILEIPVPVIAAMEGHALGGGLALGLAADVPILAAESRYGCPFMTLGFTPGMGTTTLLEEVLSPALAREMLFGGEPIRGRDLAAAGAGARVLPKAEVSARADELARRIADKPRFALALLKRALSESRRARLERARTVEVLMHEVCFGRPETLARLEDRDAT